MPQISVIIPAYNAALYIAETIDSVLSQDYPDVEIIVVDDGSTDDTVYIVSQYGDRIKIISQTNTGCANASNVGFLNANGDYILILGSDDLLLPGCLTKLASALEENSEMDVSYAGFVMVDEKRNELWRSEISLPSGQILDRIVERNFVLIIAALFRRSVFSKAGLFDCALEQMEDWDFLIRTAVCCNFKFVPEHLAEYRQHSGGKSKDYYRRRKAAMCLLQKIKALSLSGHFDKSVYARSRANLLADLTELSVQAAWMRYDQKDYSLALKLFFRAIADRPARLIYRGLSSALVRSAVHAINKSGRIRNGEAPSGRSV